MEKAPKKHNGTAFLFCSHDDSSLVCADSAANRGESAIEAFASSCSGGGSVWMVKKNCAVKWTVVFCFVKHGPAFFF